MYLYTYGIRWQVVVERSKWMGFVGYVFDEYQQIFHAPWSVIDSMLEDFRRIVFDPFSKKIQYVPLNAIIHHQLKSTETDVYRSTHKNFISSSKIYLSYKLQVIFFCCGSNIVWLVAGKIQSTKLISWLSHPLVSRQIFTNVFTSNNLSLSSHFAC